VGGEDHDCQSMLTVAFFSIDLLYWANICVFSELRNVSGTNDFIPDTGDALGADPIQQPRTTSPSTPHVHPFCSAPQRVFAICLLPSIVWVRWGVTLCYDR